MAWIESHQAVGQHPKTIELATSLKVNMPAAVGYLHYMWWWALDFAPTGHIRRASIPVLAKACYWHGNPSRFWAALVEAGFVDASEDGGRVHDWYDYAGRLLEKRAANRMRSERARNANGTHIVRGYQPTNQPEPTGHQPTNPIPLPPSEPSEGGAAPPTGADLSTNGHTGGVRTRVGRVRPKAEDVVASACCPNFAASGEHWEGCPVLAATRAEA